MNQPTENSPEVGLPSADSYARPEPAASAAAGTASAFSPFNHIAFTVLWAATVMSFVGTWMHDVAAGWLMTSLSPSPIMVALVQTALTLPIFLLALPAGALADMLDRRRLLMFVQGALAVVAAVLGFLVLGGYATPWLLLGFTFLMGVGAALTAPAWQAIVPQLVPRSALQPAVAINSVGVNISRAIGPALAGFIITATSVAVPFLINALSFLFVVAALAWWRPPAPVSRRLPPEHLVGAIRTGLRYARASEPLRASLVRAIAFFLFASAYWALLPLIVRQVLAGGPELYGIILGCVGAGAVAGAVWLPALKARFGPDRLVAAGTVGTASVLVMFATVESHAIAAAVGLLAGASWIAVLTSLNVSVQVALPDWVRARGLSIFVMVFFGAMSLGSLLWGQIASLLGIPGALLLSAVGALLAIPLTWSWKLQQGLLLNLSPSMHWPEPLGANDVDADRGPVMVTVEYFIRPTDAVGFVQAIEKLRGARQRDGAYTWGLYQDAEDSGRYVETFLLESWLDHLRQHSRVTESDRLLQKEVDAYHVADTHPKVSHLLASLPSGSKP